ncbi:MAG: hypothetical protein RPU64_13350 [Candidatus Sedimenticola sp. (ex Thyasira tokunagai)]
MADALKQSCRKTGKSTEIGMPHLPATHTVVLYRYPKEHSVGLPLRPNTPVEVLAIAVPPPKSPAFIKSRINFSEVGVAH